MAIGRVTAAIGNWRKWLVWEAKSLPPLLAKGGGFF
jgi:hypothetical protein